MSVAVHRAGETRAEADLTVPAPRPYRMPVLFLGGGGSRAACAGEAEATARSAQSKDATVPRSPTNLLPWWCCLKTATLPQAFCKKSCTRLEVRFDLGVDFCFSQ
jgi:hypothetical protein